MIIAISFILGLGLWLYGLKTAFVTDINIDAIFFLLLGGQLVKIWYAYISDQNFDEWKKRIEEMLKKR
jgi:glycopeptide antibiotics resistance protein